MGLNEYKSQRESCRTPSDPHLGCGRLRLHQGWRQSWALRRRGDRLGRVRLIQVKVGTKYLSGPEREQISALTVPANVIRESWRVSGPLPDTVDRTTLRMDGDPSQW